jgi:ketopantoate reductase
MFVRILCVSTRRRADSAHPSPSRKLMNVAIVGTAAMGSFFGGRLAAAGHEVGRVDMSQAHIEAINRDGLRVTGGSGDSIVRLRAGFANQFTGARDLVILFTKTVHSTAALRAVAHLIGRKRSLSRCKTVLATASAR